MTEQDLTIQEQLKEIDRLKKIIDQQEKTIIELWLENFRLKYEAEESVKESRDVSDFV